MMGCVEHRWAVVVNNKSDISPFLAGRFCWDGATNDCPEVPTFKTKKLCKEAIKAMRSYRKDSKPIRVKLSIEVDLKCH